MRDFEAVDFLSIPDLLKATPSEEGGRRFVYLEASNEATDQQGESIASQALADSAEYYLRYGNLDLDHVTQIGPKKGITDYALYEIGRPVDVRADRGSTFVKGEIFAGDTPVAACANTFWDSLTKLAPPQRWYPSVAGAVLDRGVEVDPETNRPRKVIKAVRWTNIGFSKTPVNSNVPTVGVVPFGVLAKCWGAGGLDISKALEAGYGTDSATLTGGGALREESLDGSPQSYWDFRDKLARHIRRGSVDARPDALVAHVCKAFRLEPADAAEWTERFLAELKAGLSHRRTLQ